MTPSSSCRQIAPANSDAQLVLQRRLGELEDKINDLKRKRRAAQDDEELDRGVKKAKVLFKAITTYP